MSFIPFKSKRLVRDRKQNINNENDQFGSNQDQSQDDILSQNEKSIRSKISMGSKLNIRSQKRISRRNDLMSNQDLNSATSRSNRLRIITRKSELKERNNSKDSGSSSSDSDSDDDGKEKEKTLNSVRLLCANCRKEMSDA